MRTGLLLLLVTFCCLTSRADEIKCKKVCVIVLDKKTRDPIAGAEVQLQDSSKKVLRTIYTDKDGWARCVIPDYSRILVAKKLGVNERKYLSVYMTRRAGTDTMMVELEKVTCGGGCVKIENVYFDLLGANIRPDAAKELGKLTKIMKDNPTLVIEIAAHTDANGEIFNATQLSSQRAESVLKWFVEHGIKSDRIVTGYYGSSRLVNKCAPGFLCNEEENQENRRVEFKILRF